MRVDEEKQFLLDYKAAIDRQLEKAERAKDKSRMIGTTTDLNTADQSLSTFVCSVFVSIRLHSTNAHVTGEQRTH